jgi:ribose/xylose/arabinose/galactoside ABC-type transport system permease subunit
MANDVSSVARPRWRSLLAAAGRALAPFLALAAVVTLFAAAEFAVAAWEWRGQPGVGFGRFLGDYWEQSTFLTVRNARTMLVQSSIIAVAALGMTLVIVAGGIDLSAGTALALCATAMALVLRDGHGWLASLASMLGNAAPWDAAVVDPLIVGLALAAALLTGLGCGLANGALVSALRVVPFIVTLGTMTIYLGIAKWLADETTVRPATRHVPQWIPALVDVTPEPRWLLVSTGVWLALGLAVLVAAMLRYTVFGRHVFAIGSNEATARLCGINVARVKIAVYALAGLLIGVAGVYQFAKLSQGNPTSGVGMELRVIAAVVIGGGSLSGGRGSVLGTLAGAAIIQVIVSGCTTLGIDNPVQDMILGAIIVAAVTLDQARLRRLAR